MLNKFTVSCYSPLIPSEAWFAAAVVLLALLAHCAVAVVAVVLNVSH